jgi:hypothetical protein
MRLLMRLLQPARQLIVREASQFVLMLKLEMLRDYDAAT